jgi:hypothetical protein
MDPNVVVNLANVMASLTPETWNALINLVSLGVPAINLAGSKLNMIPIGVPAPQPFKASTSSGKKSGFGGIFGH